MRVSIEANRKYHREYYHRNREKIRARQQEYQARSVTRKTWYERNAEHARAYRQEYREKNKEKLREYYRRYRSRRAQQRERTAATVAQDMLNKAIKMGKIVRPATCPNCGAIGGKAQHAIQAHHHHGYGRDRWYDVIWLCLKCHHKEHRKY